MNWWDTSRLDVVCEMRTSEQQERQLVLDRTNLVPNEFSAHATITEQ